MNIQRLVDFKSRLVVVKKGKTTDVAQLHGAILPTSGKAGAVSYVSASELDGLKSQPAYAALRKARTDARLVGIREKQAKAEKDEKKPAAAEE